MSSPEESALSWVGKHGSPRLKKAVLEKGGIKEILWKIYLIERLALELPKWKIASRYDRLFPMKSSSETEGNMLMETQKQFPEGNVRLCCLIDSGLYRSQWSVLIMDCPWSKEDEIVLYIQEKLPRVDLAIEKPFDNKQ
jgi:hypothetical protein